MPMVDLAVMRVLGSRSNPLASILDATEGFLGVDLRGSWALRVVRDGIEPLAIVALFVGWLATGLTQVKLYEQGVVERCGRILPGEPLGPGLHVHWPWPIDLVRREATARVLSIPVGHEGEESADAGPENVLWARQHESNEFMFLLGDGRDLVTIDGSVRYRIRDFHAYRTMNADVPALLRGLVYAAVTHRTVDHSLDQVLSPPLRTTSTLRCRPTPTGWISAWRSST
jgi:regulator of protease activity HflC (stomatin/prohibitin superfamily)